MRKNLAVAALLSGLAAVPIGAGALAGEADVVRAEALAEGGGAWRFRVTVAHGDTGWDHYADKWDVLAPDGAVLGTRVLLHPHETEQLFTRSLGGLKIEEGVTEVNLRAHDSRHDYGGKTLTVTLPRGDGARAGFLKSLLLEQLAPFAEPAQFVQEQHEAHAERGRLGHLGSARGPAAHGPVVDLELLGERGLPAVPTVETGAIEPQLVFGHGRGSLVVAGHGFRPPPVGFLKGCGGA